MSRLEARGGDFATRIFVADTLCCHHESLIWGAHGSLRASRCRKSSRTLPFSVLIRWSFVLWHRLEALPSLMRSVAGFCGGWAVLAAGFGAIAIAVLARFRSRAGRKAATLRAMTAFGVELGAFRGSAGIGMSLHKFVPGPGITADLRPLIHSTLGFSRRVREPAFPMLRCRGFRATGVQGGVVEACLAAVDCAKASDFAVWRKNHAWLCGRARHLGGQHGHGL